MHLRCTCPFWSTQNVRLLLGHTKETGGDKRTSNLSFETPTITFILLLIEFKPWILRVKISANLNLGDGDFLQPQGPWYIILKHKV